MSGTVEITRSHPANGLTVVVEDDGNTGWAYLWHDDGSEEEKLVCRAWLYNRADPPRKYLMNYGDAPRNYAPGALVLTEPFSPRYVSCSWLYMDGSDMVAVFYKGELWAVLEPGMTGMARAIKEKSAFGLPIPAHLAEDVGRWAPKPLDFTIQHPSGAGGVRIVQDWTCCYAFLVAGGSPVGQVWLYNLGEDAPDWSHVSEPVPLGTMHPCASGFAVPVGGPPIVGPQSVQVKWSDKGAAVYQHRYILGVVLNGDNPGEAMLVREDCPVARKLMKSEFPLTV